MFIVFGRDISQVLWTREISLCKNNSHDLHRVITHSLVLVILCRTTACFHVISISLISSGDHPCAHSLHYFYVSWLIMTSQCLMTLLEMPHCGTTMLNDVARDIHCGITMDNNVAMCTSHVIIMNNDIARNLFLLCINTPNYDIAISLVNYLRLDT